jgi:hypothetical protein
MQRVNLTASKSGGLDDMPLLTRWFIKSGLVYLVGALLMAALMLARSVFDLPGWVAVLRPVYLHLLMVGWVTQLIMGVAYWMFPKYSKEQPRGSEWLGWAVYALLNSGLIMRAVTEPLVTLHPEMKLGGLLAASAILQLLAGWGFVINTWPRVKER